MPIHVKAGDNAQAQTAHSRSLRGYEPAGSDVVSARKLARRGLPTKKALNAEPAHANHRWPPALVMLMRAESVDLGDEEKYWTVTHWMMTNNISAIRNLTGVIYTEILSLEERQHANTGVFI